MTREEAIKIIDCYDIGFYDLSGEKIPADKLADAFDMAIEALSRSGDLISRADAIEAVASITMSIHLSDVICDKLLALSADADCSTCKHKDKDWDSEECDSCCGNNNHYASADAVQGWIPCSERMPKINQRVLLATSEGRVFVGYREKPDLVWQVTETDGRKHWVYDPESYTDDIEILPKNEDCGFAKDDVYSDGFLSVTSINYDDRFEGVTAWMPLPEPYKGGEDE